MNSRPVRAIQAAIAATICLATSAAVAQQPNGFSAKGALVVQTEFSGAKINIGGNINLEQRGPLVRVDVLSLSLPGMDAMLSQLANSQLFPPGGYSLVYDQAKHSYTVWSPSRHAYYTNDNGGSAPSSSNPAVAAATTVGNATDMLHAFAAAKALRDYRQFSASLNLTGHGTTNGHPTTGLDFALKRQERTGDPLDIHGSLKLADDIDELPVQVVASLKGAGGAPPTSMRLDLNSINQQTPSEDDFTVPAGYSQAQHLTDVLGRVLP